MVNKQENWSKSWKSSKNPSKQRKYRENAPQHVKDNLVSANLSHKLRDELDTRNLQLNLGDRVEVTRGDFKGSKGIISNIDRENQKIYINGLEATRQDGSTSQKAFKPSNLQIQALNLENIERIEKYEVEDAEEIQVDEEEVEEVLSQEEENEMMQQMQQGSQQPTQGSTEETEQETTGDQETEEVEDEATEEETTQKIEDQVAEDIVSGTISDAKDAINEIENPDYEELIQAEKQDKNRKTMIEYLENQKEE